jgi:hypothetical protein
MKLRKRYERAIKRLRNKLPSYDKKVRSYKKIRSFKKGTKLRKGTKIRKRYESATKMVRITKTNTKLRKRYQVTKKVRKGSDEFTK